MNKLVCFFLIAFAIPSLQGQENDYLEKVFLDLDYSQDIKSLFDILEKKPSFQLMTTREHFMQSAEFEAKYIGESDIYSYADSIVLSVLTCNDTGTFFKAGANNCKTIKVIYYLKDTTSINENYLRLDKVIRDSLISNNPNWKNSDGATQGSYFLTDNIYPYILIDKNTHRNNYLTVEYTSYDQ